MIRFFIRDLTGVYLFKEIDVEGIVRSGSQSSFEYRANFGNFELQADYQLRVTTQNSESFAVTVEANDWNYPA